MHAADLIAEFAHRAGLPQLQLSAQGTASLIVDNRCTVHLESDEPARRLHLYASLGGVPADHREGFYVRLLAANLFGHATGGATIGLDAEHHEVLLSRALDLDAVDYGAFESALEALVAAHEHLAAELAAPALVTADRSEPALAGLLRA